ncbi:MAG: HK97 family phage prohead protease [Planctomycetota bacterium]|jgi:hypothetical protein
MNDRAALNSFLKDAGFSTAGDLVLLEPESSETREVRSSEKAVVATISTRARDRQGDVIEPSGVRLERFRKNPVVLYAHDYEALPVARSMWERVRQANCPTTKTPRTPRTATAEGGATDTTAGAERPAVLGDLGALVVRRPVELVAKPQFHLDTELSREVWALVEKGVLSAWSVGFIPEKWERIEGEDGSGRDGGAARPSSFRILKWDLLEYSCVPVPANFQALTHELKSRRITAPALVKSLAPLGFEAPDLVATPIQSPTTKTPRTPRTATAEGGGTATTEGAKRPAVLGDLGALVVRDVVSRAFDRWLERARGGE